MVNSHQLSFTHKKAKSRKIPTEFEKIFFSFSNKKRRFRWQNAAKTIKNSRFG